MAKFYYTGDPNHEDAKDPETARVVSRKDDSRSYDFVLNGEACEVHEADVEQLKSHSHFSATKPKATKSSDAKTAD